MPRMMERNRRRGGEVHTAWRAQAVTRRPGTKCVRCRVLMGQPAAWVPAWPAAQLPLPACCQATPSSFFFIFPPPFLNFPPHLIHLFWRLNWVLLLLVLLLGSHLGLPLCCYPQGPGLGEDVLAINGAEARIVMSGLAPASISQSHSPGARSFLQREGCREGAWKGSSVSKALFLSMGALQGPRKFCIDSGI